MPANPSLEFIVAQKRYLEAKTNEEKIEALEEMLKNMPKHKGAENLRAELRRRYKKLKEKIEETKKKKTWQKEGIKKEEMQAVLIGLTNSGKSSLISCLTNAKPEISLVPFTTKKPIVGMMKYEDVKIQIIDMPAINFENFDQGIANNADLLLFVITNPKELDEILPFLTKARGKKLVILNKIDLLEKKFLEKYEAQLSSKKYDFISFSCKTKQNLDELKKKIFESFDKIRIYTKQPGKEPDPDPIILAKDSTPLDVAEKIKKGLSKQIIEARVTGPSSKFPNQKVSLDHKLKDKDIVEFKFR